MTDARKRLVDRLDELDRLIAVLQQRVWALPVLQLERRELIEKLNWVDLR